MSETISRTSAGVRMELIDRSSVVGLEADVWPSEGLRIVLELSEDAPGRIGIYFQRDGFNENEMTGAELDAALVVIRELKDESRRRWPRLMQEPRK